MDGQSRTEENIANVLMIIVMTSLTALDSLAVKRHKLLYLTLYKKINIIYILQEESQENLLSVYIGFGLYP